MTNVFSTLRTNIGLFPKFAAFVAAIYALIGLAIAVPVAIYHHSVFYGVSAAVLVLFVCVLFDFLTYYVIAASPIWFSRCQEFASAFARIFLTKQLDTPSKDNEDWGDYEAYDDEDIDEGSDYPEEGDFVEDITPDDELSQVEDLDEGIPCDRCSALYGHVTEGCSGCEAMNTETNPTLASGILPHKYLSASDDIAAYQADQCGRQAVTVAWAYEHLVDEPLYVYILDSMTDPWLTIDAGVDYNCETDRFILCYGSAGEMSVTRDFRVFASKKAVEEAAK